MELKPRSLYAAPVVKEVENFPNWDLNLKFLELQKGLTLQVQYTTNQRGYEDCSGFHATLSISTEDLAKEVSDYEELWQQLVKLSAFEKTPDEELQETVRQVVRKGEFLFRQVFAPEGPYIDKNIAGDLKALRKFLKGPRILRILDKSQVIQIPWNLLYDGGIKPDDALDGFLGCRHIWVQKVEDPQRRLEQADLKPFGAKRPLDFSVQLNATLEIYRSSPKGDPSTELDVFLKKLKSRGHVNIVYRDNEDTFCEDLRKRVASNEDFLYFCCHGHSGTKPYLQLTEGRELCAKDIDASLGDTLFLFQPLVFINACFGGKIGRVFYNQFAPIFLDRGANAIIGPLVDVPSKMATQFACLFFHELFLGQKKLPDGTLVSVPDVLFQARQRWLDKATWLDLRVLLYTVAIRDRVPFELTLPVEPDVLASAS